MDFDILTNLLNIHYIFKRLHECREIFKNIWILFLGNTKNEYSLFEVSSPLPFMERELGGVGCEAALF